MRVKLLKLPKALGADQTGTSHELSGFRDVCLEVVTWPPGKVTEAGSADGQAIRDGFKRYFL